jgi:UDP-3-O-[3-hydroxymyristoyl] glucosamine N-acyltransferase
MINLSKIILVLNDCEFIGDHNAAVNIPINFDHANRDSCALMWIKQSKIENLYFLEAGTVICPSEVDRTKINPNVNYFISQNPRQSFAKVLRTFFIPLRKTGISKTSFIHETVKIGDNASIGHFVTIHENVVIGSNVYIDDHTVIKENTVIGSNVIIGANCTIGGVGFGYEQDETGDYELIPHIGNVLINDYVEIGNNSTIDRAVMGSTILEENVKVDNLVHIAHGVNIGRNSMIIANAMVAGSVQVGENVWVAPSSSIINGITIGKNAIIGLGAVIVKHVVEKDIIIGNPGRSIKKS